MKKSLLAILIVVIPGLAAITIYAVFDNLKLAYLLFGWATGAAAMYEAMGFRNNK